MSASEVQRMRMKSEWVARGWTTGLAMTIAAAVGGCESSTSTVDASTALDAGGHGEDAGHDDGGHAHDAGGAVDAGHDAGLDGDAGSTERTFAIRFAARAGDAPVTCSTPIAGVGLDGAQSTELVDFRFYVHAVELLEADGTATQLALAEEPPWQHDGVALLDFEDGTARCTGTPDLRDIVRGTAPDREYTGIRFVLGVPFAQNHQDAATAGAPLNLTALFWSWQGGYKFARIDTSIALEGDARAAFNVHLGSTGCDGTPGGGVTMCTAPNRASIELDGFDAATSIIAVEYAQLVEGLDLRLNTPMTAAGCMSGPTDPECAEVLGSFGLPFGGAAGGAQDVFRVIEAP